MKKLKDMPKPLLRRIVIPPLVAAAFLLVGIAVYLYNSDKLALVMSAIIVAWSVGCCVDAYAIAATEKYDEIICACIKVRSIFFRRRFLVELLDIKGVELSLMLGKGHHFCPGQWYRVFMQKDRQSTSIPGLSSFFEGTAFIGQEETEAPEVPQ